MTRYIAFLRAINVGGHVVKMDALRQIFEDQGLARVETFIASGNVVFETAARGTQTLEKKIAAALHSALGYEVATFIRSAAELAAVARHQPFTPAELSAPDHNLYIGFLARSLSPEARQGLLAFTTPVDDFHTYGREVYWLRRIPSGESKFSLARLEKALRIQATFRNATTVRRMAAIYGGRKKKR